MRRYACAWCTAEVVGHSRPAACVVCGEVGEFLFTHVEREKRGLRSLGATLQRLSVSPYATARSALRPPLR